MTQAELKELYNGIICREIWPDSVTMQKYAAKNVAYLVELSDGSIVDFEKPTIKTNFCFGAGCNGFVTSEEWDNANKMADHAAKSQEYFKNRNLQGVNAEIDALKSALRGEKECYVCLCYFNQERDSRLKKYSVCCLCDSPEYSPAWWSNCRDLKKLDNVDIERLLDGLKEVKKGFEKRLDIYLKRYGLSKIRTWSYISD